MRAIPHLARIEAQLMPFSGPVDPPLLDQGFHLYTRQFMLLDLQKLREANAGASAGMRIDRWNDRYFEPCAKLIYLSYANHVDGEINDQYRSRFGALKFLKNIILLPGCGQFVPGPPSCFTRPAGVEFFPPFLPAEWQSAFAIPTQSSACPATRGNGPAAS